VAGLPAPPSVSGLLSRHAGYLRDTWTQPLLNVTTCVPSLPGCSCTQPRYSNDSILMSKRDTKAEKAGASPGLPAIFLTPDHKRMLRGLSTSMGSENRLCGSCLP
jgi:hypothetical protein